jgi:hypothetical protein
VTCGLEGTSPLLSTDRVKGVQRTWIRDQLINQDQKRQQLTALAGFLGFAILPAWFDIICMYQDVQTLLASRSIHDTQGASNRVGIVSIEPGTIRLRLAHGRPNTTEVNVAHPLTISANWHIPACRYFHMQDKTNRPRTVRSHY